MAEASPRPPAPVVPLPVAGGEAGAPQSLVAVAAKVSGQLDAMLPAMGASYQREVAEYAAMAPDEFAHVLLTSRAFVARFVEALARGVDRPAPEHARLVEAGRRRQQAGISLDAAMHAFRIASRVAWTSIADVATAEDPLLVGELAGRWIEYVDLASTAFAEGHTSAATEQVRRVDARREALVADLLAAEDAGEARAVAARHALRLPVALVPVLVAAPDTGGLLSRVQAAVPNGALVGHRGDHLVALVPAPLDDHVRRALSLLARDAIVVVGRGAAAGAPLLRAVATAESVLGAALGLGRTTGSLGPSDLVLERVVREHDDLADHLREAVLAPLVVADADGIFRSTLRAWLAEGSVRRVAEGLFVHANTVTYRLRRVQELTGLDPRVPADAAQLVLALALDGQATAPVDDEGATA